jgi:hypothetical protein
MAEPTAQQVHIDQALTNVAIRYSNENYVYDQIFPRVPVQKQTNKYFKFTKEHWFRDDAMPRAPGTRAVRVDYELSTDSYTCVETAVAKSVPDEVIDNADNPLSPMVDAVNYCSDKLMLAQEIDVFAKVFGNSVWSGSATPSTLWSSDTADPLGDMETAIYSISASIARSPNVAVIGRGLWRYLKNSPDVVDRIKGGATPQSPAELQMMAVSALVGIPRIILATALKNTADEGETASYSFVGGNHMWVGYVTPSPSISQPSAGYIFYWKTPEVNRYREDQEHQNVVEVRASFVVKATAADAGYLIKSAAA